MVDEPGIVAADRGVDHDVVIDGKEPDVMPHAGLVRIPGVCLVRHDAFSGVLDQARASGNRPDGERAQAVHR
jgi:hypothetical protein